MTWSKRIEVGVAVLMAMGLGSALTTESWFIAAIIAVGVLAWLWMAFTQPDFTEEN